MESEGLTKLEGSVECVTFYNDENGYTVFQLAADQELVTVVGNFADLAVGEEVSLWGEFTTHPKYGLQFKTKKYLRRLPATAAAIQSYLSSRAIKGVGPAMAKKIVAAFGEETLNILETAPEKLAEVEGISEKKALKIAEEYKKVFGVRNVMNFLEGLGVPASYAIRTWKQYGGRAQELVTENPYLLCTESIGVSFRLADAIALQNGVGTDDMERLAAGILHVMRHNVESMGHSCLPEDKLCATSARLVECDSYHIKDVLDELVSRDQLVRLQREEGSYIYLPRYYEAECQVASRLSLMLQNYGGREETQAQAELAAYEKEKGLIYADRQREAVLTAVTSPVMILTGGPGTGKTTAISAIIRLLEGRGEKVALAAPTGRAAKRMSELCGIESKTVHRLLEVDYSDGSDTIRFKRNEKNPLPFSAVIIDETSMMDTLLFDSLLRAMKFSCRLILVGDPDQLPPVGAGNILIDLIESGCVPVVHLEEIFRQAAKSMIVTNAHEIVSGRPPHLEERRRDGDFFFLPIASEPEIARTAADLCARRLPAAYGFSPLSDIQVVAPMRVGMVGTEELNRLLQQVLNPPEPGKKEYAAKLCTFREGDKVMQIRNNYDILWTRPDGEEGMGIFNGDIGVIELIDRPSASMVIKFDDRTAEYSFEMARELELAYAITVHKSQGNEYDAVILPLPPGNSRMHYRSLLYTAFTRAKKLLVMVGSAATVRRMVDNAKRSRRYTSLCYLLHEVCDEKVD